MSVRRAIESDLEAIHPLLEQLMYAEAQQRLAIWNEVVKEENYAAWVAEEDRRLVGFIDLFIFPDVAHGHSLGVISNLVIDEHFRGRGLGKDLLREAIEHCKQRAVAELHVWTDVDNEPAITLYERQGFIKRSVLLELQLER